MFKLTKKEAWLKAFHSFPFLLYRYVGDSWSGGDSFTVSMEPEVTVQKCPETIKMEVFREHAGASLVFTAIKVTDAFASYFLHL